MKSRSLKQLFLILLGAKISLFAALGANPAKPVIPNTVFNVTTYGAIGDGLTDNTLAIQATIKAAVAVGGGTVDFPRAAKPYECGPITLAAGINFQIDSGATLQCISYAKYPLNGTAYTDFISASGAHDLEISGKGTIDGQGADWWSAFNANSSMPHRPYLIKLNNCTTVYIHDVTLSNSPMFHLVLSAANVTIDKITISAPSSAPNTDGIDPAGSNYLIENCTIATGDDNIAIKPGNSVCKNFTITDCTFGTGHGLSIGGQTNDGLDSLTVTHCTFNGTTNGIRLKANRTNGGLVQHLLYSDITMNNVQYPVLITSYYEETFSTSDPAQAITATTPIWKNITIRNLVSTNSKNAAVTIQGLPETAVQNITFANASFSGSKNFSIAHAHGVNFFNTTYNGTSNNLVTSPVDATISHLTITAQPQSQTVAVGASVKLTVVAAADFTPVYQWFHNSVPLANNNAATLTLTAIQGTDAGSYMVSLSESAGSIFSDSAIVTVKGATAIVPEGAAYKATVSLQPNRLGGDYVDLAGHLIGGKIARGGVGKNFYVRRVGGGR